MFAALLTAALLQVDPALVLGQVERDLTGDGQPEVLRLVGVGPVDNLAVTFTIEAAGRTIFRFELPPLTRTVGFDAGRQVLSPEEHRARIKEFGPRFFAEEKFRSPEQFVAWLGAAAPQRLADVPQTIARDRQASDAVDGNVIWQEIQKADVTVFTFSSSGDALVTIGWSARAERFYRLLECC